MIDFEHCSTGEAKVAKRLVRAILADGFSIRHNDGEEDTGVYTKAEALFPEMCATGEDYLTIVNSNGAKLGTLYLVYGNANDGSELVADYSDNAYCRELVASAER